MSSLPYPPLKNVYNPIQNYSNYEICQRTSLSLVIYENKKIRIIICLRRDSQLKCNNFKYSNHTECIILMYLVFSKPQLFPLERSVFILKSDVIIVRLNHI